MRGIVEDHCSFMFEECLSIWEVRRNVCRKLGVLCHSRYQFRHVDTAMETKCLEDPEP